jgi:Flp pilus assembly protein TadG
MPEFIAYLRHFLRDERATSTMEFIIMFPVIILLFVAVFETGIILSRQVLLERSLDSAVRVLRLARGGIQNATGQPLSAQDIEIAICNNTRSIPNCREVLTVELTVIDQTTYAMPARDLACVDRQDRSILPSNQFTQGVDNELVLIRTCAVIDRILPFSGFALNLARDDSGGLHMVAASIFVNEPD